MEGVFIMLRQRQLRVTCVASVGEPLATGAAVKAAAAGGRWDVKGCCVWWPRGSFGAAAGDGTKGSR